MWLLKSWPRLHLFFFFSSVSYLVLGENLCKKILEIWQKQIKNQTCVTNIFVTFADVGKKELPKFRLLINFRKVQQWPTRKKRKYPCKSEFLEWRKLTTGVNFLQKETQLFSYPIAIYDWLKVPQSLYSGWTYYPLN